MLEQFHKYTMESGQPIKVFAVDVWERQQTNEEKKAVAMKFWEAQKYSVPLVFDFDSKVAQSFGVQAIPTTVVIGPDGRVAKLHRGASNAMVELLKKESSELLAATPKASG
jgi:peroxiredoxin